MQSSAHWRATNNVVLFTFRFRVRSVTVEYGGIGDLSAPSAWKAVLAMILSRHDFEHRGKIFSAELRIVGFALADGSASNPRWVVFDEGMTRHWTLPGDGMLGDSADDVRLRFNDHLARISSTP
jgi:hypothetical protein